MNGKVKIEISRTEWHALDPDKQEAIKEILEEEYGFDVDQLLVNGDIEQDGWD